MKESTINLMARAIRTANRVERTLAGARPRDLQKRFRHLLRPSGERAVEYVPALEPGNPPERVELPLSWLGLAGHLRQEAWRTLDNELREKLQTGAVTGRHRVVVATSEVTT